MEQFAIPAVGGIILKSIDNVEYILLQERCKSEAPDEIGLLEIPGGKIRAFKNIFDALKREILEETGLEVIKILGENKTSVYDYDNYQVVSFMPFSCSQNIKGNYPIMEFVFICYVKGCLLEHSGEAKNYKWIPTCQIEMMLNENLQRIYPMDLDALKKYISTLGK
ncbi:MAG: NUDIX domain-containing protein [Clostridiaceae bacterium]